MGAFVLVSLASKPSTNSSEGAALGTHAAARSNAADGPSSEADKFGEAFASALQGNDAPVPPSKSDKSSAEAAAKPSGKQAPAAISQPFVGEPKEASKQAVAVLATAILASPETPVSAPVKELTSDAKTKPQTDLSPSVDTPGKEKDDQDKKVQPESSQGDVSAVATTVNPVLLAAIPVEPALPVAANSKDTPAAATNRNDAGAPQPVSSVPQPQPVLKDQSVQAAPIPATAIRTDSEAFAMTLKPKLPAQGPSSSTSTTPPQPKGKEAAQSTPAVSIAAAVPAKSAATAVNPTEALNSQGRGNAPEQTVQPIRAGTSSATNSSLNTPSSLTASGDAESGVKPRDKDESILSNGKNEMDPGKQDLSGFGSAPAPVVKDAKSTEAASDIRPATQLSQVQQDNGPAAGAAKEVAIRLQSESGETIDVKLVDQGGQVQVTVRSTDAEAASALRQDLSSLTSSLDKAGWKPEISMAAGSSFEPMAQTSHQERGSQDSTPGNRQQEWQQETPRKRPSAVDVWDEIVMNQTA